MLTEIHSFLKDSGPGDDELDYSLRNGFGPSRGRGRHSGKDFLVVPLAQSACD